MKTRRESSCRRMPVIEAAHSSRRGFTLTEILVAVSIAALVFSAASLLFQAIGVNGKRLSSLVSVPIGTVAADNFYGMTASEINVYSAPNYGRGASAEEMRELFWEDVSVASAVFCLGRNALNTVRPATIPYPDIGSTEEWKRLDTPESFRLHLVSKFPAASTIFGAYRNVPTTTNGTVFILGPSGANVDIDVISIYEIDFLVTSNPAGTYDPSVIKYRIPVVVHVIRQNDGVTGHISEAMVQSQIDVLGSRNRQAAVAIRIPHRLSRYAGLQQRPPLLAGGRWQPRLRIQFHGR